MKRENVSRGRGKRRRKWKEKCNNSKRNSGVQDTDKNKQRTRVSREEISEAVAKTAASLYTVALASIKKKVLGLI